MPAQHTTARTSFEWRQGRYARSYPNVKDCAADNTIGCTGPAGPRQAADKDALDVHAALLRSETELHRPLLFRSGVAKRRCG
jgi:hypothetical protein